VSTGSTTDGRNGSATAAPSRHLLSAQDLIPDHALVPDDQDAFHHDEIASQVAALAAAVDTPANIALFGPWGSGKSSIYELVRRHSSEDVVLVRYDAWKFGGSSLRRNFISHAATVLGFEEGEQKNRRFHRGLYENQRVVDFSVDRFLTSNTWAILRVPLFVALFLIVAVVVLVSLSIALVRKQSIWDQLALTALGVGVPLLTWVVAALGGLGILAAARVDIEQSAPSADEEFTRTFRDLVARATEPDGFLVRRGGTKRLVFFVDELDRCSRIDVVETLTALKTFLDEPNCVFIVAADRDVLEEALRELPQATPTREFEPYYSSASAFIDKVFQHQIALPPLRPQRLTRFARDLVVGRSGIWESLRHGGRGLDDVVSVLIPAHVRSPRRVKVLLNNYATNCRIAEARGIDWFGRALEIAKLTALQTEFPTVARDLYLEPRLASLLVAPPQEPTALQAELLMKHAITDVLPTPVGGAVAPPIAEAEDSDPLLLPQQPLELVAGADRLRSQQRTNLRRYLVGSRSTTVPDPRRDLLFLESAGAAQGFDDESLGQAIEDEAVDEPGRVIQAVLGASEHDQRLAVVTMAGEMEGAVGKEQDALATAMCKVAEYLTIGLGDSAAPAAVALAGYQKAHPAAGEMVNGMAWIGALADDPLLLSAPFDNSELVSGADVGRLWALYPRFQREQQKGFAEVIASTVGDSSGPLFSALEGLPVGDGDCMLSDGAQIVGAAIVDQANVDRAAAEATATTLFERTLELDDTGALTARCNWVLLSYAGDVGYETVLRGAARFMPSLADGTRVNRHVLTALRIGPPRDWGFWGSLLRSNCSPANSTSADARLGPAAIEALLSRWMQAEDASQQAAATVVDAICATGWTVVLDPALLAPGGLIAQLFSGRAWVGDAGEARRRAHLYVVMAALGRGGALEGAAADALPTNDVSAAIGTTLQPAVPALAEGLRVLAPAMSVAALQFTQQWAAPLPQESWAIRLRLALELRARALSISVTTPVAASDVISLIDGRSPSAADCFIQWLKCGPSTAEVGEVMGHGLVVTPQQRNRTEEWAAAQTEGQRTELWRGLSTNAGAMEWRRMLRHAGLDLATLVNEVAGDISVAPTGPERADLVERLIELAPFDLDQERQGAQLVLLLLERETQADFRAAAELALHCGQRHRMRARLRSAFDMGSKKGRQLPKSLRSQLEVLGLISTRPRSRLDRFLRRDSSD
jgi:hypothetical protein